MSVNKNIFYTFLTQLPVQLLGILSGVFIARMIGPEGKGVFAIYQANAQILVTFFALSFNNVLTYFVPSGKIKQEKLLGMALIITSIGSILIFIVIIFSNYFSYKSYLFPVNYTSSLYMIWLFLFSFISIVNTIFIGFLQGLRLFSIINKIYLVNSVLNFLFFGVLLIVHNRHLMHIDVRQLLYCLLAITLINAVQYALPFYKKIKIIPDFKISFRADIKPILSFAFYTHLSAFIAFFNSRLSLWILNKYLNEIAIGLFSLAMNLIVLFNIISASIGNVLMPFLSDKEVKNKNEMFYFYSKINFTVLAILGILTFFLSVPLIPFVYGNEFKESALLLQILLPGILLSCTGRLFAVFIAAHDKQQYNLYAAIAGFVVNIFFNFYLIKFYGLIGASIAGSLTYIITFLAMMYYVHIKLRLPLGNYFFMSYKEIKIYLSNGLNRIKVK